jgi:flavin reductase (DIM6/NTAB) family NADH-FMN oxidoreductase RutF
MAAEAMQCGIVSNVQEDKVERLGLELVASAEVAVPGLKRAIANLEMRKRAAIETGDHLLVVGQVLRFSVNTEKVELPLLSFGPDQRGFHLLAREGIHRLGTVRS